VARANAQADICRPFFAEARLRFQASPYEICGAPSGIGDSFFFLAFVPPLLHKLTTFTYHRFYILQATDSDP